MGTRAKNGMGSIRQRADGLWEGRYTAPDGRQRSVYAKDSRALPAKLRAAQVHASSAAWVEPAKMRLREWLSAWMETYKGDLKPSSRTAYGYAIKRIEAVCGDVRLASLRPVHVARVMASMRDAGLSQSTQQTTLLVLGSALKQAVRDKLIPESPADGVKPPRKAPHRFAIIDRPDFPRFYRAAGATGYGNELVFMLLTGLRVGELRGLRWEDVDLQRGAIHVRKQLGLDGGRYIETDPKRDEVRTIVLPQEAVRILHQQRIMQSTDRLICGPVWVEDALSAGRVFRQHNGRHHSKESLESAMRRVSKEMGIKLTPHSLRHSNAVAALRSGVDPKTVQHNLGHKSAAMTLDIYAAYTSDAGAEGARKLDAFLGPTLTK